MPAQQIFIVALGFPLFFSGTSQCVAKYSSCSLSKLLRVSVLVKLCFLLLTKTPEFRML